MIFVNIVMCTKKRKEKPMKKESCGFILCLQINFNWLFYFFVCILKLFLFEKKMRIIFFLLLVLFLKSAKTNGACMLNNENGDCVDNVSNTTCSTYNGSVNSTSYYDGLLCVNVTSNPIYGCCQLNLDFVPPCRNITAYTCSIYGGMFSMGEICDHTHCPLYVGSCTNPINNTCLEDLFSSECASYNWNPSLGKSCSESYRTPQNCHICTPEYISDYYEYSNMTWTVDCHQCSNENHKYLESYVFLALSPTKSVSITNPSVINGNIGGFAYGLSGSYPNIFNGDITFNVTNNPKLSDIYAEIIDIYNRTTNCSCTNQIDNFTNRHNVTLTHGKWCYYGDNSMPYNPMTLNGEIIVDGQNNYNPEIILYSNTGFYVNKVTSIRYINGAKKLYIISPRKFETSQTVEINAVIIVEDDIILTKSVVKGSFVSINGNVVLSNIIAETKENIHCDVVGCCKFTDKRYLLSQAECLQQSGYFYGNYTTCEMNYIEMEAGWFVPLIVLISIGCILVLFIIVKVWNKKEDSYQVY